MSRISARRTVATSFLVNVSDIVLSLTVAIISGSVVMLSQALQGVADLLTSGLLLVGVRQANRRADRKYRFGYGRELYFWILMSAISMLTLTSSISFYLGWQRWLHPEPITNLPWALAVLAVGLFTNGYAVTVSFRRLHLSHAGKFWRKLKHSSLIETKATLILDCMGVTAAAVGMTALIIFALTGDGRFDGLGAMIIGAVTAILAVKLVMEAKDAIIGKRATDDIEQAIARAALKGTGVKGVLDLRTMYLGSERLLVNMEVHLDEGLHTRQIEELTDEIKRKVKRAVPMVRHIQVEVETPRRRSARA
ncbi:cation diffusion facilitator family transporter [Candidatus Parcubacteria bacterium]|nr:cation diffusion facilitator family transporter [Candidatus Parcubacteria bacterium]